LSEYFSIRIWIGTIAAGFCLGMGMPLLVAQSGAAPASGQAPSQAPGQTPSQGDNPFPGEPPKAPPQQTPASGQSPASKPQTGSDNPFPGEDTNAPILPSDPGANGTPGGESGAGSGSRPGPRSDRPSSDSAGMPRRDADPDGDPVRTPDPAGLQEDDGFSSSRSGLTHMPAEDDSDVRPGKSTKNKTREQLVAEDLDVGSFYMEKKNWKAAQTRFAAAFALDAESPEAVWGLAEAERHLQLYKEAAGHYRLFLTYDPDGPHGKAARKGLEEAESAAPSQTSSKK
jgi:tetratricopeptide (TPR) repeat protein